MPGNPSLEYAEVKKHEITLAAKEKQREKAEQEALENNINHLLIYGYVINPDNLDFALLSS